MKLKVAAKKKPKRNYGVFRNQVYIPLEDVPDADWTWIEREIHHFDILWNLNTPIKDMAKQFKKSEISIFLMACDRVLKGELKPRDGWKIW